MQGVRTMNIKQKERLQYVIEQVNADIENLENQIKQTKRHYEELIKNYALESFITSAAEQEIKKGKAYLNAGFNVDVFYSVKKTTGQLEYQKYQNCDLNTFNMVLMDIDRELDECSIINYINIKKS